MISETASLEITKKKFLTFDGYSCLNWHAANLEQYPIFTNGEQNPIGTGRSSAWVFILEDWSGSWVFSSLIIRKKKTGQDLAICLDIVMYLSKSP